MLEEENNTLEQYLAEAVLDFREFIVTETGDTAVLFTNAAIEKFLRETIADLRSRARQNIPPTLNELRKTWDRVQEIQTAMIAASKTTEPGREYLHNMRVINEMMIHQRDLEKETQLAAQEGRDINPRNIRYPNIEPLIEDHLIKLSNEEVQKQKPVDIALGVAIPSKQKESLS